MWLYIKLIFIGVLLLANLAIAQDIDDQETILGDCPARVLLVVNDQVVSKTIIYSQDGQQTTSVEQYNSVSEAAFVSSFLTQFFLASQMTLSEPSQLLRELQRQDHPQTDEQHLILMTTVEADFIVTAKVGVNSFPYKLDNGNILYDAEATVILTVFRASSGGEIVAEYFLEGRSRIEYPSENTARKIATERAINHLNQSDGSFNEENVLNSQLITQLCQVYISSPPTLDSATTTESVSMRIEVSGFSSYDEASKVYYLLPTIIPGLTVVDFTFNTAGARYSVSVPSGTNMITIADQLEKGTEPKMKVIKLEETYLSLEVESGL